MNRALWAWVLEKAWKVDMKFSRRKSLIGGGDFENDARLNRSGTEWEN